MLPGLLPRAASAEPEPEKPSSGEPRIGLCLAGGGFQASFLHLGTIRYLEEADTMEKVEVVSTVSGGSILGAYFRPIPRKKTPSDGLCWPERVTRWVRIGGGGRPSAARPTRTGTPRLPQILSPYVFRVLEVTIRTLITRKKTRKLYEWRWFFHLFRSRMRLKFTNWNHRQGSSQDRPSLEEGLG